MKQLLILVLGLAAGGAAVIAAGLAIGHASATPAPAAVAPQHLNLVVLDEQDHMVGANLVLHPGPVVLRIVNRAAHTHLFSVPGLGVQHVVLPHAVTVVRFTVHDGVFHWFCKFPPCADSMSGDLYVSDHPATPHGTSWATAV
jgi:hypothetical protein